MFAQSRVVSVGMAEELFFKSVPPAESNYSAALSDQALEQRFIQRQLDVSISNFLRSYFHFVVCFLTASLAGFFC